MTQITREDVLNLAQLSSIQLTNNETAKLQKDISSFLSYVSNLDKVDTDGVEPTFHVTDRQNVWREDKVIDYKISRETLLKLSPDSYDNQVKVPKIL